MSCLKYFSKSTYLFNVNSMVRCQKTHFCSYFCHILWQNLACQALLHRIFEGFVFLQYRNSVWTLLNSPEIWKISTHALRLVYKITILSSAKTWDDTFRFLSSSGLSNIFPSSAQPKILPNVLSYFWGPWQSNII